MKILTIINKEELITDYLSDRFYESIKDNIEDYIVETHPVLTSEVKWGVCDYITETRGGLSEINAVYDDFNRICLYAEEYVTGDSVEALSDAVKKSTDRFASEYPDLVLGYASETGSKPWWHYFSQTGLVFGNRIKELQDEKG